MSDMILARSTTFHPFRAVGTTACLVRQAFAKQSLGVPASGYLSASVISVEPYIPSSTMPVAGSACLAK